MSHSDAGGVQSGLSLVGERGFVVQFGDAAGAWAGGGVGGGILI